MDLNKIKNQTTWNDAASSLNDNFAKLKQAIALGSLGTSAVMLDTEMSDESENVVQNKVIKKYVDDEIVTLEGYAEEVVNDLENNIKTNPSEYVKLKTINGKSLYGSGNIVIEGGEGGSGLQYSVERTVYLTKGVDAFHFNPPEIFEYEISEEERQYNKETLPLNNAFISIEGLFFHFKENLWSGEETIRATYERISIRDDRFLEELVTLYSNGDAVAELKEIKTGGSETPSDMNSDFSNDF